MVKRKRLLWQIYPSYLLIILVSITAATVFASRTLKTFTLDQNVLSLTTAARIFEPQIISHLSPPHMQTIDRFCKINGVKGEMRITVIMPSGVVTGDSEESPEKMDNHLDRLFERFYRVDKARSRKLGGTGLGLAIVKHITQAHKGRVTVESKPNEGSTFKIHLPEP